MRKKYSSSFKAQIVLEILKEEKTISELAAEYGVPTTPTSHSTLLSSSGIRAKLYPQRAHSSPLVWAGLHSFNQDS